MKIIRLAEDDFWAKYLPLCKAIENPSKDFDEKISNGIDDLDAKLKKELEAYEDDEDYCTSYDWNSCWHHCGGLYGKAAYCADFVVKIHKVLSRETDPWCFHLACEPDFEGIGEGQIFFYDGKVYGDASSSLDYSVFEK